MKIGILSLSLASNIGGILQNYALHQILKELGHKPMTIDVGAKYSKLRWLLGRVYSLFTLNFKHIPFPYYNRIGSYKILKFAMNNIERTEFMTYINPEVISLYHFDAYIVGSDQVWRKDYNANLYGMYLDFVQDTNVKKIAYAASIGVEKWDYNEKETLKCKSLIAKFNAVSVREDNDVELCKRHLSVDAVHVLDPTMLLGKEEYVKVCDGIPKKRNKTLFAYLLDLNNEKFVLATKIAESLDCQLIVRSAENNIRENDSIEEWLALYRDASFIVTDSYHGTLFSIIFRKDFITIPNKKRGMTRFKSILQLLGLSDRIWENDFEILNKRTNWEEVESRIETEKRKSINFLRNSLHRTNNIKK